MIDDKRIPVFLLTGFLGGGKTTLLNRMLDGRRDTAIIINEFGSVAIDHDLVRQGREMPMLTSTGCMCCARGADLRGALDELLRGRRDGSLPQFSRVIVETTGLADPAPIINSLIPGGLPAQALRDHAVARAFRLSGVIVAVDVAGIAAALEGHAESLRQIAFADQAVLTHTDHAAAGDWPARLRQINPGLQIHDAQAPGFDPHALLRPGTYSALAKGDLVEGWLAAETITDAASTGHASDFAAQNRHGAVRAIALQRDMPIPRDALARYLAALVAQPGILRLKGLIAPAEDPSRPLIVHAVGHRLHPFVTRDGWPDGPATTRLVVIGTGLDAPRLQHDFAALPDGAKSPR